MKNAIVLVTDHRGLMLTEHAAAAAVVTQKGTREVVIFCHGFDPVPNATLVQRSAAVGATVVYRALEARRTDPARGYEATGAHAHVSSTALFKAHAIHELRGVYERVVYIDGDVLLMGDIGLEAIDFQSHPIAAVYDIALVGDLDEAEPFASRCATRNRSHHYFNSGVIAVDLSRWNQDDLTRYEEAAAAHTINCDYKARCTCRDQCAWNRAFENDWARLPLSLNFQACAMFTRSWRAATVRHYVGPQKFLPYKPWRNDDLDTVLLNRARHLLELPRLGHPLSKPIRLLNTLRQRWASAPVEDALRRLETLRTR